MLSTVLTPSATLSDKLRSLADEAAVEADLYVVEIEVRGHKGTRVIDVYVDGDEGVGVDTLKRVSRQLSFLLDTEDLIDGAYRLNVSSPGADRPLKLPRQYSQHVGRTLMVAYDHSEGNSKQTGTLTEADDQTITLDVPGQDDPVEIPHAAIREARVVLPW